MLTLINRETGEFKTKEEFQKEANERYEKMSHEEFEPPLKDGCSKTDYKQWAEDFSKNVGSFHALLFSEENINSKE